jgi:hypothetical protein
MPQHVLLAALVCVLGIVGSPGSLAAAPQEQSAPVAVATRITEAPQIDGALDEAFWRTIAPVTDFKQREPEEGAEPTERTEVRIAYDEAFLYFGLTMLDSEPERIRRSILQREGRNDQDDHVRIGLDTYHDGRNSYIFEFNPYGTQDEAIVTDEGSPNWAFQSVFWSEGRLTDEGWTLEVAIPFSSLRYSDVDEPTMGIVVQRAIRRKNEEVYWPLIGNDYRSSFAQVSRYATLTGFRGLQRSRKLQVKPYTLLGGQKPGKGGVGTEVARDVGFDARYAVTAQSTLDLTVNTDFAQVEVDNAQVNLTRFSLFFPEKRDFFLEWDGLFRFGAPTVNQGSAELEAATYYSRRIGLNQSILGGARYGGKNGPFWIGLMDLQTKDEGGLPGANHGVARIRADVAPAATVGMIFTNVQGGGLFNRAAGGDVNMRFFRSSSLNAWTTKVWDSRSLTSTAAGSLNLLVRNDKLSLETDYLNVGRNFDPAVGFVRRRDMIRYRTDIGYYPRFGSGDSLVRQVRFNAGGFYIEGQDHEKQSSHGYLNSQVRFETGDDAGVDVVTDTDRVVQPFRVAEVEIPAGDYDEWSTKAYVRTNSSRRLYAEANTGGGTFYGGDHVFYGGLVAYKFAPQLNTSLKFERNAFDLPLVGGNFSTTVVSLNVFAATGRKLYSNSLIQYDSVSRDFTANIRVRFLYRPGSDFFLVVNTGHRFDDRFDPRPPEFDRRAVVTKLTYMFTF